MRRRGWIAVALVAVMAAVGVGYRNRLLSGRTLADTSAEQRRLVARLRQARAAHDLDAAADVQADLARLAFAAAERTARAWLAIRDPRLGLLPRNIGVLPPRWNYRDVAADCYGHLVIAAHMVAPDLLPALTEMLAAERRIVPLFATIDLSSGAEMVENEDERIFGGVEYAKDGLLPILEALGETRWATRLDEVVEQLWSMHLHATRSGTVMLGDAEKNGEMLQVLARLWHRKGDDRYLTRGRAIVEAHIWDMFPLTGGLVPRRFDFANGRIEDGRLRLRDHGNEMVAGLVEWMLVERTAPDSRSRVYAPAVEKMLDQILARGRQRDGLWSGEVDHSGGGPGALLNDNWGYISAAYVAYAQSLAPEDPRRGRYLEAARRSLEAVTQYHGGNWEKGRMDGYADTLESALYLLAVFDDRSAADWVDDEMARLLAYQQADGFVSRMYLDGNFIRTSLLYALWKTAGIRPLPWRADVSVGAERDGAGWRVAAHADAPWQGTLMFDGPRHRETLHLPVDYPRLNGWPEWFAVESDATYAIDDLGAHAQTSKPGAELRGGLTMQLRDGVATHWRVAPASPDVGRAATADVSAAAR